MAEAVNGARRKGAGVTKRQQKPTSAEEKKRARARMAWPRSITVQFSADKTVEFVETSPEPVTMDQAAAVLVSAALQFARADGIALSEAKHAKSAIEVVPASAMPREVKP